MKKILLVLSLLFLAGFAMAQSAEDYGFTTDGVNVRWQRVFDSEVPFDADRIIENLLASGRGKNIQVVNGKIFCELNAGHLLFDGLGYSRMRLPVYLTGGDFIAAIVIELKEDRFRVTASRMGFIGDNAFTSLRLEEQALKGTAFNPSFTEPAAKIIDYNLTLCLSWLNEDRFGDDW